MRKIYFKKLVLVKLHSVRLIIETYGKYETPLSVSGPTVKPPTPYSKISIRIFNHSSVTFIFEEIKHRNDPSVNWSCKYGVNIIAAPNVGAWGGRFHEM